ncbi:uncharacterized protein EV422DRAFT_236001 [Fimicolochytrium jonesii]|uniref:uncharacterized protein n=1 Tax=Fimicolochytrium jonesii TaxID=1396493 RepID=UPI0022FDF0D7|nr:uncharacterized protein EV422DRAFT_236001 [Fimicolochytrium jonesii]KAI8824860.1 hypothetical protein EV422DRAFT_236001 [Fimicolochytrium jonesii]
MSFNPETSPVRNYDVKNELDRLRLGDDRSPNTGPTTNLDAGASNYHAVSRTQPHAPHSYGTVGQGLTSSMGGQPSQAAQAAYTALQNGPLHTPLPGGRQPYSGPLPTPHNHFYHHKSDPKTQTVTLTTTTQLPHNGRALEATDTYSYRRPETSNGEYGNFPRHAHKECLVNQGVGNHFGKVVRSGDRVVPLGGPGSAEQRPGLARHGAGFA